MLSVCLCFRLSIYEQIFMNLGKYNMPPMPISTAYFTNPSHQSVSLLRNGWVKNYRGKEYNVTIELLDASFSMQSVSYQKKEGD
jgi:hypothetical protein